MKTKILSVLLCAVMIFCAVPLSVYAEDDLSGDFSEEIIAYADEVAKAALAYEDGYEFDSAIPLQTLADIMHVVHYEYPELFCISTTYDYYYITDPWGTQYARKVMFRYTITEDEYAAAMAEVDQWSDGIMSLTDPDFTDLEYLLFFHDYLCANYEYDLTYTVYRLYDFIKLRKGVCEAYTLAMTVLLEKAGIESSFATSTAMNHAWNIVKIDGEWYHVDTTWDDPVGISPGMAYHTYFLKSDSAIQSLAKPHHSWESIYTCTSATYDNGVLDNPDSPYTYTDGSWYYIKNYDLYVSDTPDMAGTMYKDLNLYWRVNGNPTSVYVGYFGGLVAYDGKLYLNSSGKVIEIDTATGETVDVYTHTDSDSKIYGFIMDLGEGNILTDCSSGYATLNIATAPREVVGSVNVKLFDTEVIIPGDVNGDGAVTGADISLLLRLLTSGGVMSKGADVDCNGRIDATDAGILYRRLSGGAA